MSHDTTFDIGALAQLACLLEVTAPKPGNVSTASAFRDTSYYDYLASAAAIGHPLGTVHTRPLGDTIHLAVQATRRWTTSNTNLGIILLLAPLARAAARGCAELATDTIHPDGLRGSLARVLSETTVDDARAVYAAIRLASPGGLGSAPEQDVASDPTVTLTEAMRLAADRDGIAHEYATDFLTTFQVAVPALLAARQSGLDWNDAIVETYVTLLATSPDTHIVRRAGAARATEVSRQARGVLFRGGVRTVDGRGAIAQLDRQLRDANNIANPGTTADLTAAGIFVVLLAGGRHSATGGAHATSR